MINEITKQYIRVGDDYFKRVNRPNKDGTLIEQWVKRAKATVQDDLGRGSKEFPSISKYEGFVNVPSHTHFKEVIEGFFNEYHRVSHEPKSGKFDVIDSILKHCFGFNYDFILDYIQLLYLEPTQRLPILLLESVERNTGKSTVGNLFKLIFQDNSVKLGNADLESDFNGFWVNKLSIIVDETAFEKNGIMQMLKRFSTETGKVTSNEKNKAQSQIDFFGKFLLLSNEEGKALPIEKGETRFAVFKIPTLAQSGLDDNPNIEEDISKEIPHFLHFLINRKLYYENKSRMYFDPKVYHTEQLQLYFDNNVSKVGKAIQDLLSDYFNFFEDKTEIKFTISDLMSELEFRKVKNLERQRVKDSLIKELKLTEQARGRFDFQSLHYSELDENGISNIHKRNNIFYLFKRLDFIKQKL